MDFREKLVELMCDVLEDGCIGHCNHPPCWKVTHAVDGLIAHGITVQEWVSVKDHNPEESGEYTVARKHWIDGHLESKRGKWNGVEWFVDGRESLMVAYWMPPLPLPQPPKGE